jgi:hypothetical protein
MAENSNSSHSAGLLAKKSKALLRALTSCFALALGALAFGQGEPVVAAKINFIAWGDAISGLSLKSEGAGMTFQAESFTYSNSIAYRGPAIVEIFQAAGAPDGASADSAPAAEKKEASDDAAKPKSALAQELDRRRAKDASLVALARIPAGCTRATVLLQPLGNGTYQAYVINDDPSQLPPGKLRIQNLSPFPISIKVATSEKPLQVKPNQQITVPAQEGNLIYELSYLQGTEWKYQENNIVRVSPTEQTQMLVLRSENEFFVSSGGSIGGFLQNVVLRRTP